MKEVVQPLQQKEELLYVIPNSDAEAHALRHFPHKPLRHVSSSLTPLSIPGFLRGLPLVFQREQSKGLNATYHFTFTGKEKTEATIDIRKKQLEVKVGHVGKADLKVTADSVTWLKFLAREQSIVMSLLRRKIRLRGSPRLLLAFGKCFPS